MPQFKANYLTSHGTKVTALVNADSRPLALKKLHDCKTLNNLDEVSTVKPTFKMTHFKQR